MTDEPVSPAQTSESDDASPPHRGGPWLGRTSAILVILASLLGLVWLGDTPWIYDEPLLISNALAANANGTWVAHGLMGTRSLPYGPMPTWIYQLLLRLTHDPIVLLGLRVVLCQGLTAAGLLWLGRLLPLERWFLVTLPLSPYFWMFGRLPWDNSFTIPVAAVLLPAYLAFQVGRSRFALAVFLACLGLLPLIHLMSLAVVLPFALHFLLVHRRALREHWLLVAGVAVPFVLVSGIYFSAVDAEYLRPASGAGVTAKSIFRRDAEGLLFPWLGSSWLTSLGFGEHFAGPAWQAAQPWAFRALGAVSWLALPLAWFGIWQCARKAWSCLRRLSEGLGVFVGELDARPPTEHAMFLCLGVLVCQMLLGAVTGAFGLPHYLNSTWIVHALFVWIGFDALIRRLPRLRWWVPVQAGSLLIFLVTFAWSMHALGGTRWVRHGPTIANQVEVAKALAALPPNSGLSVEVNHDRLLQNSVMSLADLLGLSIPPMRHATEGTALSGEAPPWYAIRYVPGGPPYAARMRLERIK